MANVSLWRKYSSSQKIVKPFSPPAKEKRYYPYALSGKSTEYLVDIGQGVFAAEAFQHYIDILFNSGEGVFISIQGGWLFENVGEGFFSIADRWKANRTYLSKVTVWKPWTNIANPVTFNKSVLPKIVKPVPSLAKNTRYYPYAFSGFFSDILLNIGESVSIIIDTKGLEPGHEPILNIGQGIISHDEVKTNLKALLIKYDIYCAKALALKWDIHNSKSLNLKWNIYNAKALNIKYNLLEPVRKALSIKYDILDSESRKSLSILYNLEEFEVKRKSLSIVYSLLQDPTTVFISHTVAIKIDGIDVTDRVETLDIQLREEGFRECSIRFKDLELYPACNPLDDFGSERIEVTIDSETFKFLLEERSGDSELTSKDFEIWGRDITAILDMPFSIPYKADLEIGNYTALEIVNLVRGSTTVNWELPDFIVYAETYSIVDKTPIEVIRDLAGICGALVMSDDNGQLTVYSRNYDLSLDPDFTYDDVDDIFVKSESEEYPEGYNAVLVTGYEENTGDHALNIEITSQPDCIETGSQIIIRVWGWLGMELSITVKDAEGGYGGSATYLYDGFAVKEESYDICWPEPNPPRYYQKWKIIPSTDGEISICVEEI